MATSYKLIPEADLLRAVAALRDALGAITRLVESGSGTVQMPSPSGKVDRVPRSTNPASASDNEAGRKVNEIVARVEKGGEPHKPKQFDRKGPKISDFVYVLVKKQRFTTSEAAEAIRPYVVLKDSSRMATGQVRSGLVNDDRFKRTSDGGSWIKLAG